MDFSNNEVKETVIIFKDSTTFQNINSSLTGLTERLDSALLLDHELLIALDSIEKKQNE